MRHKKIDDTVLLRLYQDEGKSQKEIAGYFGCTPPPVCRRLKKLLPKRTPEAFEKLTDKEKQFCVAMTEGKNQTDAALEAYDTESRKSAKVIGSNLMTKPEIQLAISELMEINGLTRNYRIKKLKKHVDNKDANVSLRALDMSFKLDNSYPPQKYVNFNLDAELDPVDFKTLLGQFSPHSEKQLTDEPAEQSDSNFPALQKRFPWKK
ncbi:MAG: Terminase small subunit [Syntrophorhabdaceae bacterium PtaU1.Bin034]|nr:MAG: Terminase small subunit [Syntrophorhabdaceae bacterium PtaU1.Bin034]